MHWGDLATLEYGKGLRGYEYGTGPYRVFGTNGPIGWHSEALCTHSTVIVGRKGAYRGVHYSAAPCFAIDTAFYLSPKTDLDMRWAYYQLLSQDINDMDSGSAIPSTSRDEFYRLPVKLPPLSEQSAIAHILGTLDDKIELNRRMNETLEAMARAVFKSWFVAFDPVRAKAKGRDPGLPKHIADLFPAEFQEYALGKIPKDWRVVPLPEVIEINPPRSLRKGDLASYLDMASMPTRSARPTEIITREFGSGMRFIDGDTLVARITPCLENGKTCFVDFLGKGKVGWGSTEYIVLRSKPPLPLEFAYFLARTDDFRIFAISNMSGTSGRQRVPPDCLEQFSVVVPPLKIAKAFGQFASASLAEMKCRDKESATLAAFRDMLLPELLSGKIGLKKGPQRALMEVV
jgi:type I restriction enzyme S subunit